MRTHSTYHSTRGMIMLLAGLLTCVGCQVGISGCPSPAARGVVAVHCPDGNVFVSWRNLGEDPRDATYNVYRSVEGTTPAKLNETPLAGPTFFVDERPVTDRAVSYTVRAVINGSEQSAGKPFVMPADSSPRPYLAVPLKTIEGYAPNDASVADLDGDGELDIVLHQVGRGKDNSHGGKTDSPILQGYKLDGTLLWEIDLGINVREGPHYTQFMVYDLDGDGRAEVACKTADGTVDGQGKVIGDAGADHRNKGGWILRGPEFLTVFDGLTGAELATVPYIPARHPTNPLSPTKAELKAVWGDGYGNRCDRFLACVAYLDGQRPSLVMCRGYYTRTVVAAWNWRDSNLSTVWTFDSADSARPENKRFGGQGNHGLTAADVDSDGKDEIIYGGMCVDDNGTGLYSTGLGHGDAMHVSDLDPSRPGMEVFRIQESFSDAGAHMFDAGTGEVLWREASLKKSHGGEGPGRGVAFDIDPRYKGMECWVAGGGLSGKLWDCRGNLIGDKTPVSVNFGIWWDGDLLREILDKNWIEKWDWKTSTRVRLFEATDCKSCNYSKATPCLSGDILGDWREEVIWRSGDNSELRIYTTTIPTPYRLPWLMQDRQYRLSIAWQNVGYNQPPHTSYYLGEGMTLPRAQRRGSSNCGVRNGALVIPERDHSAERSLGMASAVDKKTSSATVSQEDMR